MRNITKKIALFAAVLFFTKAAAQQANTVADQLGLLIDDAIFFSDKYMTPAADAAIYQASSSWITTPKEKKLWDVSIGLHINIFVTPQRDREFIINNSDFSFFSIENASSAVVPTALGDRKRVYLSGDLGDGEVRLESPQGINQEIVSYPYLQGSLGVGFGTEIIAKYSTKVKLKKSGYQVYGFGLKHNLSRYFNTLKQNKIHLAVLAAYSKEDVNFDFLNFQTSFGSLGITNINGIVDTWQGQVSASKEFGDFELMAGFLVNTSHIKYKVSGERGEIENIFPLQDFLNMRLEEIYKTRVNYIGELSARYKMGNFYLQSVLAFGKFVNCNMSFQYEFN